MLGRFALARRPEELSRVFDLAASADCAPHYNIAPTSDIAVVRHGAAESALYPPGPSPGSGNFAGFLICCHMRIKNSGLPTK